MMIWVRYLVFDSKRRQIAAEFEVSSEELAFADFTSWYNMRIRTHRWETRKLGRYYMVRVEPDGSYVAVMTDDEVKLSYHWFRLCDPPHDEASELACDREFERLTALDAARLVRRSNLVANFKALFNSSLSEAA